MRTVCITVLSVAFLVATAFADEPAVKIGVQTEIPEGNVRITGRTATTITFEAIDPNPIPHATGQGHEHTPCDQAEIKGLGLVVQGRPGCKRFCVDVPAGHEVVRGTAWVRECTDNTWHNECPESGGTCHVGWVRVERTEWYPDKSRACIAMKNWSHDRNRCFKGQITIRPTQQSATLASTAAAALANATAISNAGDSEPANTSPRRRMRKD